MQDVSLDPKDYNSDSVQNAEITRLATTYSIYTDPKPKTRHFDTKGAKQKIETLKMVGFTSAQIDLDNLQSLERLTLNNGQQSEGGAAMSLLNKKLLTILAEADFRENWHVKQLDQTLEFDDED